MPVAKTYLNVPYAQKDAAKALGARWDAIKKKWYAPADKDISLFAQWQPESAAPESFATPLSKPSSPAPSGKTGSSATTAEAGAITRPTVKDFAAYNGDEPPWD